MRRLIALILPLSLFCSSALATVDASVFERMRANFREHCSLGPTDYNPDQPDMRAYLDSLAADAQAYWQTMRHDTCFLWDDISLWTDEPSYTPFHVHYSYQRLEVLSRAWAYPGNPLYHNDSLLSDIRFGLGLLYRYAYNENTPMCGNWWEWRIGNTETYADIVSILYEQLSAEEIRQFDLGGSKHVREFVKKGNMTYANLADVCRNLLLIGILTNNEEDILTAMQQSIPAFVDKTTPMTRVAANAAHDQIIRDQSSYRHNTLVWKKEGLYEDGTFIQHIAIPYIGTYGGQIINFCATMVHVFEGTPFAVPQPICDVLPTWINKTYLPELYKGEIMLMFMGRGNARNPYKSARSTALNILTCSSLLNNAYDRERIRRVCADMIAADKHYPTIYTDINPLPIYKPQIDNALSIAIGQTKDEPFSIVLAAGDRVIHQTPTFRFGLAMSSNRIGKYEAFIRTDKSENNYAWYTGDGMTYLYTPDDPRQYWQYIPRMNHYRVPGTTVDMIPRESCASNMILFDSQPKAAEIARAGGVMMDGLYSSAMMQLLGSRSDLMAKKSWFCFDDEVVCLGADINLNDEREVITTVENRQFTRPVFINGKNIGTPHDQPYRKVQTAYLEGTGGYYFPQPVILHANVSENGFNEFWLSHGIAPQEASYEYVLLPQKTKKQVKTYQHHPDIEIIANTPKVQAVREKSLGITAIHFWGPGAVAGVKSDGVAAVMMRRQGDTTYLSVSDPTWERTEIVLTIKGQTLTIPTLHSLGMTHNIVLVNGKVPANSPFAQASETTPIKVIEKRLTNEDKTFLQSIYSPVSVVKPIDDARHHVMVTPQGEIRAYGKINYSSSRPNGDRAYLSSLDGGLSWKLKKAQGIMESCTYLPIPQLYIRLDTILSGPDKGTWVLRSTIGPDDKHPERIKISNQIQWDYYAIQVSPFSHRIYTTAAQINAEDERLREPIFWYSDDWGKTWSYSTIPNPPVYPQTVPDLSPRWNYCGTENVACEYAPNQMMVLLRNASDWFYWSFSKDGGQTWSDCTPSPFHGDATTPYLLRLQDGRLLCFWNNTIPLPENDHSAPELDEDAVSGRWEDAFTNRDVAHVAISEDNGQTWIGARELVLSPIRNRSDFRYYGSIESSHDKSVHQFQAIELPYNKVLVHVGQNEVSRQMMIFDINWLYEIYRHEDFMNGMEEISAQTFLKSLSGCTLASAGNGHCQWNRIQGAVMAPDPMGEPRDVVHVSRQDDERLYSPMQGITWNFPASHEGRVMTEVYLSQDTLRLSLADGWFQPSDPSVKERAQWSIDLDGSQLTKNQYHKLEIRFSTATQKVDLWVDGTFCQTYPLRNTSALGLSYLIAQCQAPRASDGFYVRLLEKDDYR